MAKEAASSSEPKNKDEFEQIIVARALLNYKVKEKMGGYAKLLQFLISFTKKFPIQNPIRPRSPQPPATTSKILSLIRPYCHH
ncbi:hypothetical protein ES319_A05G107700v1 [Gossypium barbadense]|uniref:Uncharacterized protein n=2 Tax=Gossypium TaxID=3633 RepID=A0A2P5XUC3_GOSBA|nr:hypothetical protein ES319_A05G107700v1 [Gossypium barbadense]PPS06951.1 hypothetical protein GOBAR_AA13673 [Gossypium barbadense]TYH16347.1 hypothetical protein ES288_A05G109900v1 [Gossypium darwinii]